MIGVVIFLWNLSASLTQPICAAGLNEFGAYAGPNNEWIGPNNPDTCDLTSPPDVEAQKQACAAYRATGDSQVTEFYLGIDGNGMSVIQTIDCDEF